MSTGERLPLGVTCPIEINQWQTGRETSFDTLSLDDFKVKFIIKSLRLVKLLLKFNKNFTVYLSKWYTPFSH